MLGNRLRGRELPVICGVAYPPLSLSVLTTHLLYFRIYLSTRPPEAFSIPLLIDLIAPANHSFLQVY